MTHLGHQLGLIHSVCVFFLEHMFVLIPSNTLRTYIKKEKEEEIIFACVQCCFISYRLLFISDQ